MDTNDQAAPTARLIFGQRVSGTAPVEAGTDADALIDPVNEELAHEAANLSDVQIQAEAPATEADNAEPVEDTAVVAEDAPEASVTDAEAVQTVDETDTEAQTKEALRVEPDKASNVEQNVSSEEELEAPAVTINEPTEEGKSVEELQAEREKLDSEIKSKQDRQKAEVLAQIKTVAETYGITADDVVEVLGGLKSKRKGVPAKPKYKDPATGTLWSGRGKDPAWIKGQDRTKFLIPQT